MLLFSVLTVCGWVGCRDRQAAEPVAVTPAKVTVAQPVQQSVQRFVELRGRTEAAQTIEVRAQIPGCLLSVKQFTKGQEADFREGSQVQQGDLLFVIEQAPFQARLRAAEAAKKHAEAKLKLAQQDFHLAKERSEADGEKRPSAVREMGVAAATYEEARIAVQVAESQIHLAETEIRAPISGTIGERLVSPGNLVGADANTLLTTIVAIDPICVGFQVDQRAFLRLRRWQRDHAQSGKRLTVDVGFAEQPKYSHQGVIDFIDPAINASTATARVRAKVANKSGTFTPGLFVRVRVPLETIDEALLVEPRAVHTDLGGKYLLVIGSNRQVQQRYVDLGDVVEGLQVIQNRFQADIGQGIDPEEHYVVDGLRKARFGQTVIPVEVQPEQPVIEQKESSADRAVDGESPLDERPSSNTTSTSSSTR